MRDVKGDRQKCAFACASETAAIDFEYTLDHCRENSPNKANHINYDKYHACKRSYYHIRNLSDELCREHNLLVIEAGEERGRKHIEWQAEKTKRRTDCNI